MKFSKIYPTYQEILNDCKTFVPEYEITNEEYTALIGMYAESNTRYLNEGQFKAIFFTIYRESVERLRVKLKVNTIIRNLDEEGALAGDEVIINNANNPDTIPSTSDYEALPYVNNQTRQKGNIGTVKGLYEWKHSVGGQAYGEFLDSFRRLFRVVLRREEMYYEQN